MKTDVIQLHNVSPEEFKNDILSGVQVKLESFRESLTHEETQYLTRKEASAFLGVSISTIHQWCKKGILKPYRIGNRVRFKKKDIEETLLKSNEI